MKLSPEQATMIVLIIFGVYVVIGILVGVFVSARLWRGHRGKRFAMLCGVASAVICAGSLVLIHRLLSES